MRKVLYAAFSLVFLLVFSSGVYPQGRSIPEAIQLLFATDVPEDKFDPSSRMQFAQALSAYCDAMVSATPTNTPDEQKWVDQELKTRNRLGDRLFSSAEWPDLS